MKILAVADSTGHGVPGAFMSMVGISLLNEILNQLRARVISSLSTQGSESNMSNGMDIALIVIDTDKNTVSYSGAYNPLYLVWNNKLLITKANHMPIGKFVKDHVLFTNHIIDLEKNDRIYLFTDGYKDQFGGEKNKKHSPKAFRELVLNLSKLPFSEQNILKNKDLENGQ